MNTLRTAGLVVLSNNAVLLAYSSRKQAWYLPGGKLEPHEDAVPGLQREIQEELGVWIPADALQWYCHISAPAYGEAGLQMEQSCYRCPDRFDWQPSAEVAAIQFFTAADYARQPAQVPGVLTLFGRLLQDGYLTP